MRPNNTAHETETKQRSLGENLDSRLSLGVTRRRFLATTGAVGLGTAASVATIGEVAGIGTGGHFLQIQGQGERTTYSFAVDGNLAKSATGGASINRNDTVSNNGAMGVVGTGSDAYTFDGDLLAFDFDGEVRVLLDGEPAHVGQRPDHFLQIQGQGEHAAYSFAVDGNLEKSTGHGANSNDNDEVENQRGTGMVGSASDAYTFDGDLLAFDIRGPMNVLLDGGPAHVGHRPDHVLTFRGIGERATYEFTVDGNLEKSAAYGATINGNDTIDGLSASGYVIGLADSYTYSGGIPHFDLDGSADVLIDSVGTKRSQRE